jgi:hypothetical protein
MVRSCLKLDIKLGAFEALFAPDFSDPFDLQKATSTPYAMHGLVTASIQPSAWCRFMHPTVY